MHELSPKHQELSYRDKARGTDIGSIFSNHLTLRCKHMEAKAHQCSEQQVCMRDGGFSRLIGF